MAVYYLFSANTPVLREITFLIQHSKLPINPYMVNARTTHTRNEVLRNNVVKVCHDEVIPFGEFSTCVSGDSPCPFSKVIGKVLKCLYSY